jgi:hypothetical protein
MVACCCIQGLKTMVDAMLKCYVELVLATITNLTRAANNLLLIT